MMPDRAQEIAQSVCEAIDLDPDHVFSVDIHLAVGDIPTATIKVYLPEGWTA